MSFWCLGQFFDYYRSTYFSQTGQTGKTVPSICGTNTDYHSKYFCHILVYSIVQLISIITIRLELVAKVNCETEISIFCWEHFFLLSYPTPQCMLSLERPHLTQLRWLTPWALPQVPWSGTSWLSRFLAQQITGVTSFWYRKVQKLCRFERMTSKGTDRLPAMVHRSHRGGVQLQLCWRPGQFQKIPSIKSIIGDFATVVMVDLLDGVYYVFTHYAPSSSARKTTRTASELRTASVGSSGRRRVARLTVRSQFCWFFLISNLKGS